MSEMQTEMMKATGLSQDAIAALRMKLRGDLIKPGDPQYEMARKVYNAMIDKRPALIVRPVDVADVSSAVEFGAEQKLEVAVRGGSHSGPGYGTVDGGLVIDLSRMRGVRVDPEEKTVRVEGGALLGDVDHASYPFGLAVPSGTFSITGVGGLTLGGGMGYLSRRYGLSIDNLLSVDMVLADGCFVTASKEQNEDLFWAVRGGGGNFGIVTSFLFRARPVATVYGGPMVWPIDESINLLPFWQDLILTAPEELYGIFAFLTIPPIPAFPEQFHLKKMCGVIWCYSGALERAEQALKPIRDFRKPAIDMVAPIPFPALQSMFDPLYPAGYQWYWESDFFKRFDAQAIKEIIKGGNDLPTGFSAIHIFPINGAVGRIGPHETPWSFRDSNFSIAFIGVDPDPKNKEHIKKWAKNSWSALHPYSIGSGYLNFKMDEGPDTVETEYTDNYMRLAQIKAKYDPNNLFHINQNILPKA
jgi:hypothetical protein